MKEIFSLLYYCNNYKNKNSVTKMLQAPGTCYYWKCNIIGVLPYQNESKPPLGWGGFKFENWCRWPNYWNCTLELQLFYFSQMKLKLAGLFFSKIHQMALGIVWNASNQKNNATYWTNFSRPSTLFLWEKNHLLVKKHRKVNFVIFLGRFT